MSSVISYHFSVELSPEMIPWDEFEYGVLESPSQVCFTDLRRAKPSCRDFEAGLLFGLNSELRWRRRRNGKLHLVYVNDLGREWPGTQPVALEPIDLGQIVLWGEPEVGAQPAWYESRIPQIITEYPRHLQGNRLVVQTVRYRFQTDGPAANPASIFRCKSVEPLARERL